MGNPSAIPTLTRSLAPFVAEGAHSPGGGRVSVDVELGLGPSDREFDDPREELRFLLGQGDFSDLEQAATALTRYLVHGRGPGAEGSRVAWAGVRLVGESGQAETRLTKNELNVQRPDRNPWGTVDVIYENDATGIYLLHISPHSGIPLHYHRHMDESEMVLTEGLLRQGMRAPRASIATWRKGERHRYDNPTVRTQTILCIDKPRFDPHDEIIVESNNDAADKKVDP